MNEIEEAFIEGFMDKLASEKLAVKERVMKQLYNTLAEAS